MREQFQFALGLAGMLQACFLPGLVLSRFFPIRTWVGRLIVTFALSMTFNHVIMAILTVVGLNHSIVWYVLFLIEIVLIWNGQRTLVQQEPAYPDSLQPANSNPQFYWFAFYAAIITVGSFIVYALMDFGSVFTTWDAVGSWNPWAVWWATGSIPPIWGTYPQLIPTGYAVTYLFMGSTQVQFFAKALAPIFPVMILLTLFDWGRAKSSTGVLLSVTIGGLLLYFINMKQDENLLLSGYADVPVSFFTTLVFWCLVQAADEDHPQVRNRLLYLGAFVAIGASLTKQTGLYVAGLYPVLAYLLVYVPRQIRLREGWAVLFKCCVLIGVFVAPWYLYRMILIRRGVSQDNFEELVVGLHGSRTLVERMAYGLRLLRNQLGGGGVVLAISLLNLLSLRARTFRWIYLLVTLPFTLIWAAGFSYSLRNVAIAVPLMALGTGVGLEQLIELLRPTRATIVRRVARGPILGPLGIIVVILALATAASFEFTPKRLLENQLSKQREIGDARLNQLLYSFHENRPIKGLIASHYSILPFLPGFEKHATGMLMQDFKMYQDLCADSKIRYFLLPTFSNPFYDERILGDARARIKNGKFACLFDENSWLYVCKMTPEESENNRKLDQAERLVSERRYDEAAATLETADVANLDAPGRGYYLLAFSLQFSPNRNDKKSQDRAIQMYEKALKNGFDEYWVRFNRGLLYASMGDNENAIGDLQRALDLHPDRKEVRNKLAELKGSAKKL